MKYKIKKYTKLTFVLCVAVLVISYVTYFYNYAYPEGSFFDESYYIATAQKYLTGVFFLHEHPPLGHMLIALGEKIFHANEQFNQFIDIDKVNEFPKGFSFRGYRFFPVLCAWLTSPVIFSIFLLLVKNYLIAFLLSLLYLLDNALIVHSRGAMLDAPLIFFISLTILFFLLALRWKINTYFLLIYSFLLGSSFALAVMTKYSGLIVVLLFPALYYRLFSQWKKCLLSIGGSLIGFLLIFITIWQIHFSLGNIINPNLKNNGFYTKNPVYQHIISQKQHHSLLYLPIMVRSALEYAAEVNKGIPPLNLCKSDENGSPAFFWPLGARSINYRWETTDSGKTYRYLYLQSNPMVWFLGLWGVIATTCLMINTCFFSLKDPIKNRFLMVCFLSLYWGYMITLSQLKRATYLHHYFPALLFSFCLFALWIVEVKRLGKWSLNRRNKMLILSALGSGILAVYCFYSPLTYYHPLTDAQFRQRMIFPLWDLRCVKCERTSFFNVKS
jgi:dolichyl-phosphate-mannose--protein O-mannosyl transferase